MIINHSILAEAITYYQNLGYQLVEVPWAVSLEALEITSSSEHAAAKNKYLVSSAEQSFLQLILEGKLNPGKYCALTPCFRDDVEDELHQKHFLKVELIYYFGSGYPKYVDQDYLKSLLEDALCLLNKYLPATIKSVEDTQSDVSYDITCEDIELGSYGLRQHNNIFWAYGTGVAEPRLSIAIDKFFMGNKK